MDKFRSFLITSALLIAAPFPLIVCLVGKAFSWRDAVPSLAGGVALLLLYWWPLGAFLAWYKGRWGTRFLIGYALSLPLYFLSLEVLYPAWGSATFHPFIGNRWLIYLSATPQFYGMVRLLFYLSTSRPARVMRIVASSACAVGLMVPVLLIAANRASWPARESASVVITGARIVDAASNRIIDGQSVYIQDGRIMEIGPEATHADWPRIDAQGQYLLPGLIDVHTHLQSPVEVLAGFKAEYFVKSVMSDYGVQRKAYLEAGVTSIRDLGGMARKLFDLREDIRQKKTLGPRLFAVGRLVTSPQGHPVSTIWTPQISREGAILAEDERSMLDGLGRNFAEGPPDAAKFVHGTIGEAKEELSVQLLTRGVEWANQHGLISVVHAETIAEVEDALRAGATGVEHTAYLQDVPDALAAMVAERHPFLDPTFGEYRTGLGLRKIPAAEIPGRMALSYQSVRTLANAGAILTIGTDAPMVPYGLGYQDELGEFACAGFAPAEILTFATVNNAAYLGKAAELGRIAVGYRADLLLAKENPLEQLDTLRRPVWTMLDGQIVAGRK